MLKSSHHLDSRVLAASLSIRIYISVLATLFFLTWLLVSYARYSLHRHFPYDTPLFGMTARYSDWTNFVPRVSHYGEGDMLLRSDLGLPYPYPLPSLYLYLIVIRVFQNSLQAYKIITILIFSLSTAFTSVYMRRISHRVEPQVALWLTLLMGFPALFLYDRGNIEVFIWLFVLLGLLAYLRDWKYLACLLFALAGCMKIYPAIFLLLFIPRKQYQALLLGAGATVMFSLLAIAAVGPSVKATLKQMSVSAQLLKDDQILAVDENGLRFDHSILAEEKQAVYSYLYLCHRIDFQHMPTFPKSVRLYSILAPLTFLVLYVARVRHMPLLNQFMALTLFSVLLPYVSYEYTLVHIYIMLGVMLVFLLIDGDMRHVPLQWNRIHVLMACFGVVVAPLSFFTLTHYSGQIKGLVLFVMLVLILDMPLPSTLFGDSVRKGELATM